MCSTQALLLFRQKPPVQQKIHTTAFAALSERGCIIIWFSERALKLLQAFSLNFGSLLVCFQDKVATESLPLLGFTIAPEKEEGSMGTVFHLYHKQTLFYSFRAEDNNSAQRYGGRLPH